MSSGYYQLPGGRVAAIEGDCPFPPLSQALTEPNGLVAIGGDLSSARLLSAYRHGIFPWFNEGEPILWWSPNPRMVLFPDELKISKSLSKTIKKQPFELRINTAFQAVMQACSTSSRPEQNGTWISPQMVEAYCQLHELGYAISSESWLDGKSLSKTIKKQPFELRINTAFQAVMQACSASSRPGQNGTWISPQMVEAYCQLHELGYAISSESWLDGKLVGGCYGVKIGKMFYGESMFHHATDASKIAFVNLVEHLKNEGVGMIDCQMKTPLLTSFGGREIARDAFVAHLNQLTV